MVNCAVSSCKRRSSNSNLQEHGISYHIFPRDPFIREKWRVFCGNIKIWTPTRTSVICSEHFTPESFVVTSNNRRKLVEGAVPTLKRISCASSEIPVKNEQIDVEIEITTFRPASHSILQPSTSQIQSISPPSTTLSESISEPPALHLQQSTATISGTELVETPRERRLRKQLLYKTTKIRRLQAKNRYLQKKIDTLQELLLNELEEKSL